MILYSREDCILYTITTKDNILGKAVFSVTYFLTHVLQSYPAFVKQVITLAAPSV